MVTQIAATGIRDSTKPMNRLLLLLIALMLIVPLGVAELPARAQDAPPSPLGLDRIVPDSLRILERSQHGDLRAQVRVERRVIVRIAPSSDATRVRLMSELPRRPLRTAYEEVEHGNCVTVADIVGVQPVQEDRLLLFTRDRQVLTALLARSCSARAFYSGFYVERNDDGRVCVGRDELHSREGTSCQVTGFRRLVAVRD